MIYEDFIASKQKKFIESGFITNIEVNPTLFDFQQDIVRWALKKGKSAIFAGTGLGKTFIQLEFSKHVYEHEKGNILIVAPLAVSQQTKKEGEKLGIQVNVCRNQNDVKDGINITNYEMLQHFDASKFIGIVLDESSILKSFSGAIRNEIIEKFVDTKYKLACTATPAPNDYMELGNHCEFLGVMSFIEMLSSFFVHDGGDTAKWRLKGHAEKDFWNWMSSWSVMLKHPKDLGYNASQFDLVPLNIHAIVLPDKFGMAKSLQERRKVRQMSVEARVNEVAKIANSLNEPVLIWCDLNVESDLLHKNIHNSYEIRGSHDHEYKSLTLSKFVNGNINRLISKPSICGFGMNLQNCSKMIFTGLSDSFEQYYQSVRRCWRFGQTKPVDVYIITSASEGEVVKNIKRKEDEFNKMIEGMISATQEITSKNIKGTIQMTDELKNEHVTGKGWDMYLGDCVEEIKKVKDNTIGYTIFSPPFSSLYVYSNSLYDMGNSSNYNEFYKHFEFLASELYRVLQPGRLMSIHCMNLPITKQTFGYIGIQDFRGEIIRLMQKFGFIYHSEVCIWKDPVTAMQRTKALGLLYKQIKKDSTMCRQGIPDYLVTFRKPGENQNRVSHTEDEFPLNIWQNYASPIWMDINPSDTLQRFSVREDEDERHICPLQLEVIRRGIELWTKEGDIVFSPFAGIGSEGYEALKYGRKFIGIELKKSYYDQACKNLESVANQTTLTPFYDKVVTKQMKF